MGRWNDGFPQDITEHYYSLWNNDRLWLEGMDFSLKDIFCLPNVYDLRNKEINIKDALEQVILGDEKFYCLLGGAGSGKTSLISYMCNIVDSMYDEIEVRVWSLPKAYNLIRIVMGECEQYAHKAERSNIVLVFENIYGYHVNLQEVYEVIKQRQDTCYPNISVIITCRESEADKLEYGSIKVMKLNTFLENQIYLLGQKYDALTYNNKNSYDNLKELLERFGSDVLGNPVVLMNLLNEIRTGNGISTESDLFYLLLKNEGTKDFRFLIGLIAFIMFSNQERYISEKDLYDSLLKTGILKGRQSDEYKFVQHTETISNIYEDDNFQKFFL